MIDNDHQTFIVAGALALGLFLVASAPPQALAARSLEPISTAGSAPVASAAPLPAPGPAAAPSVQVVIVAGSNRRLVASNAATVGDLLGEQGIRLAHGDRVEPEAATPLSEGLQIRVMRRLSWIRIVRRLIPSHTVAQNDSALPSGTSRIAFAGAPGTAEYTFRYTKDQGAETERALIAKRILRTPRARVVVHGVGEYRAFAGLAFRGFQGTVRLAGNAMRMIATAYTASCSGCSGFTASGARAGHGIVAVDPHVIPLGSKLFIPGYGQAVAGDTGGSIVGNRIDLGFNSLGDALRFGRRPITVYLLR